MSKDFSYGCIFCGEFYSEYEARGIRMCCCGEQLEPADQMEEEEEFED